MSRRLTVACLQTRPMPDFAAARAEALGLARRAVAAGAQLLLLPEYCGGLVAEGPALHPPAAAEGEHPVVQALADLAARHGVWVLIGSVAVPGPGGRIRNRSLLLDAAGRITARYDKLHLFDVRLSETGIHAESATVAAGEAAVLAATPWGPLGLSICYDLRFPQLYRALAQAGAVMLAVPAAFTATTGPAHWHVLNRARAIENGAFVLAPCAHGPVPGGGAAYGHSLIVGPWGEVLADAGEGPGLALAGIDLEAVAEARRRIPALTHDRPWRLTAPGRAEAVA
ncbi:MAG: carbon-nitrogen hydrolase family protein [Rhodobacteraceae bacterium]|nr:carbon-nitrogen hydrolase family protein [Paracoccaceae bacterium]